MYNLPKFDYESILKRAEGYCVRHGTGLTLGYALWLTGTDDAEDIYAHSVCNYRILGETVPSMLRFRSNISIARRGCMKLLYDTACSESADPEMLQNLQDYCAGLFCRLNELRETAEMAIEERTGLGIRLRGWVYERR